MTLTMEQAENLASRILADLGVMVLAAEMSKSGGKRTLPIYNADRARVASDLAGLRWCETFGSGTSVPRTLFSNGLLRTAALYGVSL